MNNDFSDPPSSREALDAASRHVPAQAAASGRNLGRQIARISWWACFLAIILNFVVGFLRERSAALASGVFVVILLLIAVGLICAVIALLGMRAWGRDDVARPALVGLLLSLAMVALMGKSWITELRKSQKAGSNDDRRQWVAQQEREAFLEAGWLGMAPAESVILTLSTMPGENPLFRAILDNLKTDATIVLVAVQNLGSQEAVIDTTGAVTGLDDGTQQPTLDAVPILEGARRDRDQLMRAYSPPLHVPAGTASSTWLFTPPTLNWRSVRSVTLNVNGVSHVIRGQFMSREEKYQLLRPATQPATQAP